MVISHMHGRMAWPSLILIFLGPMLHKVVTVLPSWTEPVVFHQNWLKLKARFGGTYAKPNRLGNSRTTTTLAICCASRFPECLHWLLLKQLHDTVWVCCRERLERLERERHRLERERERKYREQQERAARDEAEKRHHADLEKRLREEAERRSVGHGM